MNKAYRHVYKDGIGWVAIAENASSVSSSKGSGTVSSKTKVEVLKNFFDLRNSVVLNSGFLLKGLFAATLFCGVFVGDLRAETSQNIQDKAIATGGTAVYVDDGGKRFIQNKQGGYIDTEGKGLIKIRDQWYRVDNYDEKGVITLSDGKKYVIPTGTLNAILYDKNYNPYMVAGSGTKREITPVFFDIEMTLSTKNSNKIVKYDENDKKWYVYNNDGEKLYLARKKEGGQYYGLHKYSELDKNSDGVPKQDKDGYYVLSSPASVSANEVRKGNTFEDLQDNFEKLNGTPDFNKNTPTRLGLVGLDGINTMPKTYTTDDKTNGKIPAGRKVGDNKDGTIRLGNVAKAELDDEAVNLGQLNETLKNLNTGTGKVPYVSISSSITGDGSNYNNDGAKGENAIAIGPNAQATDNSAISVGYNAGNGSENLDSFVFIGNNAGYKATNTSKPSGGSTSGVIAIGRHAGSESNGDRNLFIGSHAGEKHTGSSNIFIGDVSKPFNYNEFAPEKNNRTDGDNSQYNTYGHRNILVGAQIIKHSDEEYYPKNDKNINDTISIGTLATAGKEKSIAIGSSSVNNFSGALATGKSSIAIGSSYNTTYHGSISSGEASIALGASSKATEYKSIAIGTKSKANAKESVAIGNESIATRGAIQDKKDVYLIEDEAVAKTASRTKGAVSVGFEGVEKTRHNRITGETYTSIEGDIRRQITNVAAGSKDSDAVNIAQLKAATGSNPQLFKFLGVTDKNYADKVDGYEDGGKYYDGNGKELPKEKISIDSDGRITKLILSDTQDTPDGNGDLTVKYDRLSPLNSIKTVKIDPNTNKPEVDQNGDFVFEYTVGDSPKNYFETINDITNSVNKGFYTEANFANNEEKNTIIKHQLGSKIKVGGNFKPLDGETLTKDNINNYLSGENLATSINKDGSINLLMAKTPTFNDINISKDGKGGEYTNLTQWIKKIENSSSTSTGDKIKYFSVNSKEVGNRNNDGAKGKNAIAIGQNAQAKAQNVVAIGESAGKTQFDNGSGSVFIGRNAGLNSNIIDSQGSENWGSAYIGQDSGVNSKGDGNIYMGSSAGINHQGSQNIFLGDGARNLKDQQGSDENEITKGNRNIAIGNQYVHNPAKVYRKKYGEDDALNDTITIGTGTRASANGAIAIGSAYDYGYDDKLQRTYYTATAANGVSSIALGSGILVNSKNGVAVGFGSSIVDDKVTDAVALGSYSQATTKALDANTKNVYLGNNAEVAATAASTKGAISVGSEKDGLDENKKTVKPFTRQITNLAAGTQDADAVNVAQLKAGIKNVVKYDSDANDKITLSGLDNANPKVAGGVTITNLKAGDVSKNSKDAINGSQLHATNESIKQNTDKITKNEGDITTINQKLDGFNKDSLFKVSNNGADTQNIGLNGEVKFNAGDNIELTVANDPNGANVKYSLNKELKNITSITNNGKKYTFGDTNLVETSVITNKDLTEKGYVTADTQKTTSVSTDTNSGIKVADKTTGNNTDYTLSLDKDKVKEIAGTTNLTTDLAKKADKNAGNLEAADVASWQKKLGDGTNNAGNTGLITGDTLNKSLKNYSDKSDKTAKVLVKGDGLKLDSDETTNVAKYTLSLDEKGIKKLAGTEDLDDLKNKVKNKADIDATNVEGEYLTKWQEKLGVSELSTAINNFNTNGMFKVSSNSKNPEAIVPNAVVDFTAGNVGTDTNLIVSHTKTNDGVKVNYTLNNELKNINSIGGNGKTVSFTNDGVDFGGAKITNVAQGSDDTDGVNLKQVKTLIANVGTTNLVEVQTNSPMAFILDKEGEPNVQLVREKDPNDNDKLKFFRLDDKNLERPITDGSGNFTDGSGEVGDKIKISTIHPGYGVADKTKITNVKAGNVTPDSLEAINGSQLHASNKAIADILGGDSTLDDNGVVTKPTYNITNKDGANITHNTIGGALTELNKFNKNFTEEGLFSVSKDSETPSLKIKPNENISFITGSNLDLTVEKGDGDKGAKITYSLNEKLDGITSIISKTNKPLKVVSNNEEFYFNKTDGTDDEKKRNVATMGDLDSISGDTSALKKAVAGNNKINPNGTISQNADPDKTPFNLIKTAKDPDGQKDTKAKTLFDTVNKTIAAINEGFYTEANLTASGNANRVKHQLGSTIKVGGTSNLSIAKLSGENLATSINKDGSINLLLSKAPRFDSVNIGGNENEPDSGIKIAQGKDGKNGKDGNTLIFTGEDGNKGVTLKGIDGINGKDGKDLLASSSDDIRKVLGVDGKDGQDGKDAVSIKDGKLAKVEVQKDNDGNPLKDNEGKIKTEEKSPFTGIKTVELDKDGKPVIGTDGKPKIETTKDQPKTYLEATNEIIDAINKGFYTEANLVNDADTTRVKHQLGSTIKVGGTSNLSIAKLSGENLATSINKDGSINLLLSKAPRFDSVNIGGNENEPDSGIKIAQDGKDGNVLKLSKKGADGKDGKVILRGLADGKDDSDAVTKSQLDEVRNLAKGGSVGNIEFITDDNERTKLANNELNIKGDGNIKTSKVKDGEIKLSLGDEISFGGEITNPDGTKTKTPKITLGKDGLTTTGADGKAGPSITANGIDGGNKVLTNLASGLNGKTLEDIKKDIEKANGDPAKMPTEASNGATIGDLVDVDSKITNINTNITNTTNIIGGNDNKLINKDGTLTDEGKKALTTNAASGQDVIKNTNIIQAINNINKQGTRFFHVNDGKEPMGKKVREDKEDSSAGSIGSVAIGIQAEVGQNAKDAIAIGTGSQANGKNTIAIGVGNIVNGENSGAIGDPSMVEADGSYSVGNSNTVSLGANGSFILGNNVTIEKDAKQALALGEKTKVSVASGVALGSDSVANRITNLQGYIPDGATADQEKAIKATSKGSLGVVSVGETSADGKTVKASRQITGVAAGTQDSDAVNVAQLKAVQKVSQSAQWIAANNRKFDKNGKVVDNNTPAEAKGVNSVAIGAGSNTKVVSNGNIAERPNTVSVGGMNEDGTVTQRSISNVAPGVLNSDAATMGQLRAGLNDVYGKLGEYKKDASAGTASALAVGNLPQATIPGKGMVSLGSGFYDGESAMAIGLSKMSDSGKWVFKGSASYDSQEKAGAALSVGFHF
ncbi:YadA-like family protein [Campylobacter ureolyticus]|uniref:YadA-like family protein n=1 Tax=Campylobacter ureolyticus TaxID=827 RepID=UPI0022B42261|nr:YadA-like family protein [Campylobacter ureolyticus]MCZ6111365.1 YadA-like family protein [Campylobacter ureolyticus]